MALRPLLMGVAVLLVAAAPPRHEDTSTQTVSLRGLWKVVDFKCTDRDYPLTASEMMLEFAGSWMNWRIAPKGGSHFQVALLFQIRDDSLHIGGKTARCVAGGEDTVVLQWNGFVFTLRPAHGGVPRFWEK